MRMLRLIAIMVVLTLSLSGCKGKPADAPKATYQPGVAIVISGTPEEKVEKTVQRYNQLLAEGYRTLNMNALQEVTTADQAEKAYVHMAAIGEGKAKMVSELKKISFSKTQFPQANKCTTSTDEVWDFAYQNIATGATTGVEKNFLYHVNYTLEMQGDRWLITDISASSEEPDKKPAQPRSITVGQPPPGHGAPAAQVPPGHGAAPAAQQH